MLRTEKLSSSVWLDFMRGVAAMVVFAGHARVLFIGSILSQVGMGASTRQVTVAGVVASPETTNLGHQAVIVFFVLSGFLVGGSVIRSLRDNGTWSPTRYAVQRLCRLMTVLIPALLLCVLLDHLGPFLFGTTGIYSAPASQGIVFPDFMDRLSPEVLIGNLLFMQGILVKTYGSNSPLWTLSYEFWFYVAFPFLALVLWRNAAPATRTLSTVALVLIALLVGWKICFYFLIWLLGATLELLPRNFSQRVAKVCFRISVPIFVIVCLILLKFKINILIADSIQALAFASLCYFLLHSKDVSQNNIFSRLAKLISDMSYTLYLVHAPILVFVCAALFAPWAPWPLTSLGVAKFGCVLLFTVAIAYLTYWLFERNTDKVRSKVQRVVSKWGIDFIVSGAKPV